MNRCGRASQCTDDVVAASIVITTATMALDCRRTSIYRAVNVMLNSTRLNNTTACNPPIPFNLANTTSLSHSHANHGAPGFEYENMSRIGTNPLAMIHSPVRMCHPVSQSRSSAFTPSIRPNRYTIGMRKAMSAIEGRNFTAIFERASISIVLSSHPRTGHRPHGFKRANPVVK